MELRRWDEIQATFDSLVELDATARSERLATLNSSDPELGAAVESLLAADFGADARLASLEATFLPSLAPAPDPLGLAGRKISHFQVRELIGVGGMGVVYRAEDTNLTREVALKFLLPAYGLDAIAKARFLREAHAAATLDHQNLCAIYEVGASEDGRLFMAMPLYAGETLQARLARDGPMNVRATLEIARQVTEGLECAHAAGIVHRDLKPANVMLLPDGSVKILDFGLAKARDQSLTKSGARFGTVSYMSPEQIRGVDVDARSDLWALGVVLYEMLTGRKPFGGQEEIAIAHAILHDRPDVSALRDTAPGAVEDVVLRLLQREPHLRFSTAATVLTDLEKVGTIGESDRGRIRLPRVVSVLRGKQRRAVIAATVLMIAALGYAAIAWTTRRAAHPVIIAEPTAITVLPFRNVAVLGHGPGANIAGAVREEIVGELSKVSSLRLIGRWSSTSYAGADTLPLPLIASQLGVRSILRGTAEGYNGGTIFRLQLIDAATNRQLWANSYEFGMLGSGPARFAVAGDIAREVVAALGAPLMDAERRRIALATTTNGEAYHRYLQGLEYLTRTHRTLEDLEIARGYFDRAIALDSGFARALAARSAALGVLPLLGDRKLLQKDAEVALRFDPELPQAHAAIGRYYLQQGDFKKAYDEYSIALTALPNDSDLWLVIGRLNRSLGNWTESVKSFEKAENLDPLNWEAPHELGVTLAYMRRYRDAIRSLDRSSTAAKAWADVRHDSTSRTGVRSMERISGFEKARNYVLWRGELDTLRAVADRISNNVSLISRKEEYLLLLYWARQPDSLLSVLKTLQDGERFVIFDGHFWPASLLAAWVHEMRGDKSAARAAFDSARAILDTMIAGPNADYNGSKHAARGLALAGLGLRREALKDALWPQDSAEAWRHSVESRNEKTVQPMLREFRARIFAQVGEADLALDELERLLTEPSLVSVHTLRLEPIWDPIRKHPRFRALLAKYAN